MNVVIGMVSTSPVDTIVAAHFHPTCSKALPYDSFGSISVYFCIPTSEKVAKIDKNAAPTIVPSTALGILYAGCFASPARQQTSSEKNNVS